VKCRLNEKREFPARDIGLSYKINTSTVQRHEIYLSQELPSWDILTLLSRTVLDRWLAISDDLYTILYYLWEGYG